jgi:hypothetical protein
MRKNNFNPNALAGAAIIAAMFLWFRDHSSWPYALVIALCGAIFIAWRLYTSRV